MFYLLRIKEYLKKNWFTVSTCLALLGMLTFHFFGTLNPPITQPVIISPVTNNKNLKNGQVIQNKAHTPMTENPYIAGFSEAYVKDTINKVLGVKEKEIVSINRMTGTYRDSLELVKEELDEQKRLTRYYQSKDGKGNIVGTASSTEGGPLVYKGNISLTSVVKQGSKKGPDTIVFYDPTQRVTIDNSLEYTATIPVKTKKQKLTFGAQVGVGMVAPGFKVENSTLGYYIGGGISYNF